MPLNPTTTYTYICIYVYICIYICIYLIFNVGTHFPQPAWNNYIELPFFSHQRWMTDFFPAEVAVLEEPMFSMTFKSCFHASCIFTLMTLCAEKCEDHAFFWKRFEQSLMSLLTPEKIISHVTCVSPAFSFLTLCARSRQKTQRAPFWTLCVRFKQFAWHRFWTGKKDKLMHFFLFWSLLLKTPIGAFVTV